MKKIWKKITKIISNIGLALFTFGTKVMARDFDKIVPMYGIEPIEPKEPTFWEKVLPIIKIVFLPLLLIIGLIVYWKKSKAEKKKKIYITIASIIFVALIYVLINLIEYIIQSI